MPLEQDLLGVHAILIDDGTIISSEVTDCCLIDGEGRHHTVRLLLLVDIMPFLCVGRIKSTISGLCSEVKMS